MSHSGVFRFVTGCVLRFRRCFRGKVLYPRFFQQLGGADGIYLDVGKVLDGNPMKSDVEIAVGKVLDADKRAVGGGMVVDDVDGIVQADLVTLPRAPREEQLADPHQFADTDLRADFLAKFADERLLVGLAKGDVSSRECVGGVVGGLLQKHLAVFDADACDAVAEGIVFGLEQDILHGYSPLCLGFPMTSESSSVNVWR